VYSWASTKLKRSFVESGEISARPKHHEITEAVDIGFQARPAEPAEHRDKSSKKIRHVAAFNRGRQQNQSWRGTVKQAAHEQRSAVSAPDSAHASVLVHEPKTLINMFTDKRREQHEARSWAQAISPIIETRGKVVWSVASWHHVEGHRKTTTSTATTAAAAAA